MDTSSLKHFDYLVEHDSDLETALGLVGLNKSIDHWRRFGMDFPDDALVGCRKTIETALRTLTKPLPDNRMNLQEVIDHAEDKGIIDRSMAYKCHEIRKKGNLGAHEMRVKAVDAEMTLDLLDDFLRWCAEDLGLIPVHSGGGALPHDPIFIVRSSEELAEVSKKARIAAALDNNRSIERKARETKAEIETCEESVMSNLQKMQALIKQAEELGVSIGKSKNPDAIAAQETLFDGFERKVQALATGLKATGARFAEVDAEVQEILNEHDFIMRLLRGGNQATVDQHGVMAFPKGSNTTTNILQIAGGAGTGKTLCLLAKLISEVDDHGQESLFGGTEKKALFICFNKGLANYVREILDHYEGKTPNIDVESYDEFINQLVRQRPKRGFEFLEDYATDVRYQSDQIIYGTNDLYVNLLRSAQSTVAARYPRRARDYYLNPDDEEGFDWLRDELQWIEARFATDSEAIVSYPKARRIGRGTKRQPSEAMRRIILEIWTEFDRLLKENNRYTIEQATKRLLNTNNLPTYDAVAIDEVQDFSLLSIRLLLRFRKSDNTMVFLSGDENQKIYQRDFTWKELDEGLTGHTITLRKNMRNSSAIRHFSERLIGISCSCEEAKDKVYVVNADEARTVELLRRLTEPRMQQTTALIAGNPGDWEKLLRAARVPVMSRYPGDILRPGLYVLSNLTGKGLEFDNVVVDYTRSASDDEEVENRLRYVHFTRARRRLYIRYQGTPPKLILDYYRDFVSR
jgi:hypothetical protein